MRCEVLVGLEMAARGRRMLQAMIASAPAAGVECIVSQEYMGAAPVLMAYGLGHPVRRVWTTQHLAGGGRLIGWDLGYWGRKDPGYMRLSLDRDHPVVDGELPAERFDASGITLRKDGDRNGPILLCGMGQKSRAALGYVGQEWERRTLAAIRATYPRREVRYRPKHAERLDGCATVSGSIEEALRGVALAVCRHSNVAVDACIAGVPVVCEDGAAVALYGNDLRQPVAPSMKDRRQFLQNLAWWQWTEAEALQAWAFLKERLCA